MTTPTTFVNIAFVGNMGSGKSTLCGALLHHTGVVDNRVIERLYTNAASCGFSNNTEYYTWLMDTRKLERERRCTIDGNLREIKTATTTTKTTTTTTMTRLSIMDTPGMRTWRRRALNMILQADHVVVCFPVQVEYTTNYMDELRELLTYAFFFKKRSIAVVLTSVHERDQLTRLVGQDCDDDKHMLAEAERRIRSLCRGVGFAEFRMPVFHVPFCSGASMMTRSSLQVSLPIQTSTPLDELMKWFDSAQGDSLMDEHNRSVARDLVIIVNRAFRIGGVGTVLCGGIVQGRIRVGEHVCLVPGMAVVPVVSLEVWHRPVTEATAGAQVGLVIKGYSVADFRAGWSGLIIGQKRGSVSPHPLTDAALLSRPIVTTDYTLAPQHHGMFYVPPFSTDFVADVIIQRDTLGLRAKSIECGAVLNCSSRLSTQHCRVVSVLARLDRAFEATETLPQSVERKNVYRIHFRSTRCGMVIDTAARCEPFSRVVFSDSLGVVAAGVVRTVGGYDASSMPYPRLAIAIDPASVFYGWLKGLSMSFPGFELVKLTGTLPLRTPQRRVVCALVSNESDVLVRLLSANKVPFVLSVSKMGSGRLPAGLNISSISLLSSKLPAHSFNAIRVDGADESPQTKKKSLKRSEDITSRRARERKQQDNLAMMRRHAIIRSGGGGRTSLTYSALQDIVNKRREQRQCCATAFQVVAEHHPEDTMVATTTTSQATTLSPTTTTTSMSVHLPLDVVNRIVDYASCSYRDLQTLGLVNATWAIATDRESFFLETFTRLNTGGIHMDYTSISGISTSCTKEASSLMFRTAPYRRLFARIAHAGVRIENVISGPNNISNKRHRVTSLSQVIHTRDVLGLVISNRLWKGFCRWDSKLVKEAKTTSMLTCAALCSGDETVPPMLAMVSSLLPSNGDAQIVVFNFIHAVITLDEVAPN
eukprot:PhM_4_TR14072/c0_g1_i1/m.60735/K03231/EEF1A; elongation factor 1-alpha